MYPLIIIIVISCFKISFYQKYFSYDLIDLDVCKVCLKKQKGVLYKFHLKHIKVLDLAFESSIDLEAFDSALEYGLELIECYRYVF